jgi:hypothetical protein
MSIFCIHLCCSLALQSSTSLNVYNLCQDVNLISPVYFIHGGRWNIIPDQEIDVNSVVRNRLEFDSGQEILEGALVYKMQRQHTESDKSAHGESKYIQLLVVWRVEHAKELHVSALLIEHDRELHEDRLRQLHQNYWHLLKTRVFFSGRNWLLDNETVLITAVNVMNGGYRWDVFISEGVKDNVEKPLWVDAER